MPIVEHNPKDQAKPSTIDSYVLDLQGSAALDSANNAIKSILSNGAIRVQIGNSPPCQLTFTSESGETLYLNGRLLIDNNSLDSSIFLAPGDESF